METPTVMVCMAEKDQAWTLNAVHLACALARNNGMDITLVKMLPVTQPALLGSEFDYTANFTKEDHEVIRLYAEVAEDYRVELTAGIVRYVTFIDAVVETADDINARAVFASIEPNLIPFWRKLQLWNLQRALNHHHHTLYTLETPTNSSEWSPSVTVLAGKK
jgi:hypothetical protein